jgi:isopentenyl phosphate kinase
MKLVFLKLGGSLITDKTRPYTPRPERLETLASEVALALQENVNLHLVLGHGSGSFGHEAASYYQTRQGVSGTTGWRGFAEVWYQASKLNRLVLESLHRAGIPALTISPSASVIANDGKILIWDTHPIQAALSNGLLPIIHGDVAFDKVRGGTIISTEELFSHLARQLHPQCILLAGLEAGVWDDFPARGKLLKEITPAGYKMRTQIPGGSAAVDVTGGMHSKVTEMLDLVEEIPKLEIVIFSGEEPGNLGRALRGEKPGTCLHR